MEEVIKVAEKTTIAKKDRTTESQLHQLFKAIAKPIWVRTIGRNIGKLDYRKNPSYWLLGIIWGRGAIKRIINEASKGQRVLELGCGSGWLSLEIARANPKMVVDSMDINSDMLHRAREYYLKCTKEETLGRVNYLHQDLEKVLLPDNEYDCVVTIATLTLIANLSQLITEVHKALKPGGILIFYGATIDSPSHKNISFVSRALYPWFWLKVAITEHRNINITEVRQIIELKYDWRAARKNCQFHQTGGVIYKRICREFDIVSKIEVGRGIIDAFTRDLSFISSIFIVPPLKLLENLLWKCGIIESMCSIIIARKTDNTACGRSGFIK